MDRVQKFEQSEKIKNYLNKNQVFELFLNLLKQLIVNKPEKPLDFLIEKLHNPQVKRLFVLGPTGSDRKYYTKKLKETMSFSVIETGALLRKEIIKKSDLAGDISQAFQENRYVDDQIVIQLVKNKIAELEKEGGNWIIEGFPRTRIQALSLEKLGVIPDKIIRINVSDDQQLSKIKQNIQEQNPQLQGEDLEKAAQDCILEYRLNMKEVQDVYKNFIFDVNAFNKPKLLVEFAVQRMIKFRFSNESSRNIPGIIMIGPPGSGRSTQAKLLAEAFGLVIVSVRLLLKEKINENPEIAQLIKRSLVAGNLVPDQIINTLVEQRLLQSDCRVNGWVLEGYPITESQINHFRAMNLKPTVSILLDLDEREALKRLKERRVDPETGKFYNLKLIKMQDHVIGEQLLKARKANDQKTIDSLGFRDIPESILETICLSMSDATPLDPQILRRLTVTQEDSQQLVKKRFQAFKEQQSFIEEYFGDKFVVHQVQDLSVSQLHEEISKTLMKY